MYEDSLMKRQSRFLITSFLFYTRKEWTLNTRLIICLIFYGKFGKSETLFFSQLILQQAYQTVLARSVDMILRSL